jgi:thioredoxin reductase (NADPH)
MIVRNEGTRLVDVLILGGGPAGLSALLWCADLGMSSILLEKDHLGGQLHQIRNTIMNYPGRVSRDGKEMADRFLFSVKNFSDRMIAPADVTSFDTRSIMAKLANGEQYVGRAAIIATGVSRRKLNIPGEVEFANRGILMSGAGQKREAVGKRVAIVGGGDAALENALILSKFANRIFVVHRRDRFSARAEFVSRASAIDNVEFIFNTTVESINGGERVRTITLRSGQSPSELDVDLVLVRIGVRPNTEMYSDQLILDAGGYIVVDALGRTNAPNIFAAGDVANPVSPTISTAVGTAATSAKAIYSLIYRKTSL